MPLYQQLLRPLLFVGDAERQHDRALRTAAFASRHPALLRLFPSSCPSILHTRVAGLDFSNPIGLAAGFDKNGRAIPAWAALGFGHVEIGSISARFSAGNPKPRLFRLPEDRAIVVHYGLPNDGAEPVAQRLAGAQSPVPLGINLVNTNDGLNAPPASDDAIIEDYATSARLLLPHAGYLVLNLSCPNTADGRGFLSDSCRLSVLLARIAALAPACPVFLKVAPFPGIGQLEAFLRAVDGAAFVSGFSTNLPPGKPPGLLAPADRLARMPGAVSGHPAHVRALETVRELYRRIDPRRHSIIASGGVSTAADAYTFLRHGASLVQLLTALVYQGPLVVRRLNRELAALLARDGFTSVSEAVGSGATR